MLSTRVCVASIITMYGAIGPLGCTSDATRLAWETQRRADQVQQKVFDQQHESLRILLFRDLVQRLADHGPLCAEQQQALSDAWNERDLLEFWNVQHERAIALRHIGVDLKLASDQSILDLLIKSVERRVDAVRERAATAAAERAQPDPQ